MSLVLPLSARQRNQKEDSGHWAVTSGGGSRAHHLPLGTYNGGRRRILFSLKQLQYLQYYIHEARLADPAYVAYLSRLNSGDEDDKEEPVEPPLTEESDVWVPIPDAITLPEEYEKIVNAGDACSRLCLLGFIFASLWWRLHCSNQWSTPSTGALFKVISVQTDKAAT
jgi:hypothetical protein